MILIAAALQPETNPIVRRFNLKKQGDYSPFEVYSNDAVILVRSGMGKVRMASALGAVLGATKKDISYALNIGVAAGAEEIPLGSIFLINKVTDAASGRAFFPDILVKTAVEEMPLRTSENPAASPADSNELFDMEGSGFFESAALFLKSHKIGALKIVSDHFDPKAISADRIESLVDSRLPEIENYLEALQGGLEEIKDKSLSPEYLEIINRLSACLQLTKAQNEILLRAALRAFLRGVHLGRLNQFLGATSGSREDSKRILKEIEAALAS